MAVIFYIYHHHHHHHIVGTGPHSPYVLLLSMLLLAGVSTSLIQNTHIRQHTIHTIFTLDVILYTLWWYYTTIRMVQYKLILLCSTIMVLCVTLCVSPVSLLLDPKFDNTITKERESRGFSGMDAPTKKTHYNTFLLIKIQFLLC